MNSKKNLLIFILVSLIGFGLAFSLLGSDLPNNGRGDMLVKLGKALYYSMPSLALVFLILLFTPQAFPAWKKFAKWFIPIATLIFIFYSYPGSGDLLSPYPEQVFKWGSILYVIVSVV